MPARLTASNGATLVSPRHAASLHRYSWACICTRTCTCARTNTVSHARTRTYERTYERTNARTHTHMRVCMRALVGAHVHTNTQALGDAYIALGAKPTFTCVDNAGMHTCAHIRMYGHTCTGAHRTCSRALQQRVTRSIVAFQLSPQPFQLEIWVGL